MHTYLIFCVQTLQLFCLKAPVNGMGSRDGGREGGDRVRVRLQPEKGAFPVRRDLPTQSAHHGRLQRDARAHISTLLGPTLLGSTPYSINGKVSVTSQRKQSETTPCSKIFQQRKYCMCKSTNLVVCKRNADKYSLLLRCSKTATELVWTSNDCVSNIKVKLALLHINYFRLLI